MNNDELKAGLQKAREAWADNHDPNGDPLAYFFYAGAQFGTELTQQIYKDAFRPKEEPCQETTPQA